MAKNTTKNEPKIETTKPEEKLATPAAEAAARAEYGDGDGSIPGDALPNDFASLSKETERAVNDAFKGIPTDDPGAAYPVPETGLYAESHGHVIAFSVGQRFDQDAMPQEVVYPQCGGVRRCDVCALHQMLRDDVNVGRRGRTQAPWRAPSGSVVGPGDVASAMALIDAYNRFISDQMAPKMSNPDLPGHQVVSVHGGEVVSVDEDGIGRYARDYYAIYCASSGGKNFQGNPCPKWDELPEAVRGHWKTVARRAMTLLIDGADQQPVRVPGSFEVGHLPDPKAAVETWEKYVDGMHLPDRMISNPGEIIHARNAYEDAVRMVGDLLRFIDERGVVARSQAHQELLAAARRMAALQSAAASAPRD